MGVYEEEEQGFPTLYLGSNSCDCGRKRKNKNVHGAQRKGPGPHFLGHFLGAGKPQFVSFESRGDPFLTVPRVEMTASCV